MRSVLHHRSMADAGFKGKLLVASPILRDPNFYRSVILVLEHTGDGALGLVLNRPSETAVADPLPGWSELSAHPRVVFVGGPVQPNAAICLARVEPDEAGEASGWTPLGSGLGTLDLDRDPDELATHVESVRIFAGYAGWAPGQVEGEMGERAWLVVEAEPDDPMTGDPLTLWKAVLRRQGGESALLAGYPDNPSLN
jgi:putative transcriptional regulator